MTREVLEPAAGRYVLATVAVAAIGTLWCVVYLRTGAGTEAIAYVFVPVGGALATVSVLGLIRRGSGLDPVAGRFWRAIVLAVGTVTVGYAWLAADMLTHAGEARTRSMPAPAAALAIAGFLIAIWALARVPVAAARGAERWRMALDRMIAFLGCSAALWYLGLAPMLTAREPWSPQATFLVGLGLVVAVGAATKVSYIAGGPVDRVAMRFIAAAGGVPAGADAVLAVQFGYLASVPAQAVVMPLAPVFITLGVAAQNRADRGLRPPPVRVGVLLPYLAMVLVDVPLIAVALGAPLRRPMRVVLIAAVVVTALVMVRQYLAYRENARLLRNARFQEERLQHEVSHDGLTGLANRALFRDRLTTELAAGGPTTVLLLDLDDFKAVNDLLGHGVGDRLLVSVSLLLHTEVGGRGLPARVGGDEFAVVLNGSGLDPEQLAERLLTALSHPISEHRLLVQASIGIATAAPGATVDSVLRNADVALYTAKQQGKAGFVRYVDGMGEPVLAHMQLGAELRRALDNDEFRVVYQPIVRLDSNRVIGVEALVRWHHPSRGVVGPGDFIPAAERTGLIVPLGRFVLRETCRQAAAWLDEFGPDALKEAGLNVSARQLHDPDFVSEVAKALADSGLPCERLVLEVTESAVLRGPQVSRALHELDHMGIRLALDDFGTGESSLSLLRAFPAAIVKLDKSFVDGIEIDDGHPAAADARQAVARAVIQLAHALGLDTVAEGIESPEQVTALRELGYTLGQGFHLAEPMTADGVSRLLARQQAVARLQA
ncbi:putative bifunctional diguanylate cyclase/phosphodiesterase [Paractinoplanes hotanensis]|uniref:Bifunctional diguanylate cyclase/phosphodiesterase n=1 Tax=Paractinoplanes hotanensis TaxID=2906497 RepID=A0ABT0XQA4_9ACTN|nr:bifunctional diguanylate cyclase/phosphodiesterase [Actinoplanes hotanensis]MCM4075966.1 bifunctional diguanylate cyclase/phosphodiesterase [Actinoplanes hotanensis]